MARILSSKYLFSLHIHSYYSLTLFLNNLISLLKNLIHILIKNIKLYFIQFEMKNELKI
jgi:hypothetical protein